MRTIQFKVLCLTAIWLSAASVLYSQNIGLVDVRNAGQVITVGGPDADIPGFTSDAIQIALDAIRTRGGGTVKLIPENL